MSNLRDVIFEQTLSAKWSKAFQLGNLTNLGEGNSMTMSKFENLENPAPGVTLYGVQWVKLKILPQVWRYRACRGSSWNWSVWVICGWWIRWWCRNSKFSKCDPPSLFQLFWLHTANLGSIHKVRTPGGGGVLSQKRTIAYRGEGVVYLKGYVRLWKKINARHSIMVIYSG